jgi:hypothetical protein
VSQRTAIRWHHEPEVLSELARPQRATLRHARERLLGLVDVAADTLAAVMADPESPAARVSAARTVLAQALKLDERTELERRLAELEQAVERQEAARRRWSA